MPRMIQASSSATRAAFRMVSLAALAASVAAGASAEESQLWSSVSLSGSIPNTDRWGYSVSAEVRHTDNISRLGQSVARASVNYRLDNGVRLGSGVASFYNGGLFTRTREDRLWQEASYRILQAGRGRISGRTRLEQRFGTAGSDTGWRVRQRIGYSHPIGDTDFSFSIANDVFWAVNSTDWGQESGIAQNRLSSTVTWKASEHVSFDAGYMNIALSRPDELFGETRHIFLLSMSLSH